MARIYRFARLILSVDALRPVDWSELAHGAGYFDQAHFSREFKDFTGHTPTGYLALRRRFPAGRDSRRTAARSPLIDFLQDSRPRVRQDRGRIRNAIRGEPVWAQ